jgi:hypothetical protein
MGYFDYFGNPIDRRFDLEVCIWTKTGSGSIELEDYFLGERQQ